MAQYKVVERFVSINGEGPSAGQLAVFIRFKGCNLACSYCDTAWANTENAAFTSMSEDDIYRYIKETAIKNVTLTGGEPLLQPAIIDLLKLLATDEALHVEIETNGSIDITPYTLMYNPPVFTMDYKLPGSLMESSMLVSNFERLTQKDTLKFVIGSLEDFNVARDIIHRHALVGKCNVYLSAVFGQIRLEEIVELMKDHHMNGVNLQLQMHKIIWDPNEKGV
ncbi:putative 7-carboxy-7-deazaguanine synthase QueE [Acidaminobacter hydrogenoformans]|uniref:7-carboxy-7-deazaguanine synthase n=1 Tax=Acidaminobacter hydrogenoformans DSM 2784 TaxID=1120920 RepID=A0A1G5RZ86_9FIRM|nr:putative 7-carboxy-7-deazaguanine synthase QueE [Acidaminobacter hydrogenoformans]SCZ79455.1 7-carboxy-7-deazaguanine synthase [Acidaminobacter hydrogenoformans DSM 2784]